MPKDFEVDNIEEPIIYIRAGSSPVTCTITNDPRVGHNDKTDWQCSVCFFCICFFLLPIC